MIYKLPQNYYELTQPQRRQIRLQYIQLQNHKCDYCGQYIHKAPNKIVTQYKIDWTKFPYYFRKYPIHLHHDHKTGITEGAVHMYCNAIMWQYEER